MSYISRHVCWRLQTASIQANTTFPSAREKERVGINKYPEDVSEIPDQQEEDFWCLQLES